MSSKKDKEVLRNKILKGLEKTYEKLIQLKKEKNEDLIVIKDDKVVHIKPL
jgi:hypothetical protein